MGRVKKNHALGYSVEKLHQYAWLIFSINLGLMVLIADFLNYTTTLSAFGLSIILISRWNTLFLLRKKLTNTTLIAIPLFLLIFRIYTIKGFSDLPPILIEAIIGIYPFLVFEYKRPLRHWLAILNACIIAIACMTFTTSVFAYLLFVTFMILLFFLMNISTFSLADETNKKTLSFIPARYFLLFLGALPLGLGSAVLIFLAFPRVESLKTLFQFSSKARSGYSGSIFLEKDSRLELSEGLAFFVTSENHDWLKTQENDILFRGDSLDLFDGKRWTSTYHDFKQPLLSYDYRVSLFHEENSIPITIHMEANSSLAVFYPGVLGQILSQEKTNNEFLLNSQASIMRENSKNRTFSYQISFFPIKNFRLIPKKNLTITRSILDSNLDTVKSSYQLTRDEIVHFLKIPDDLSDKNWFKAWIQEISYNEEIDSILSISSKLERHFKEHFTLTLNSLSAKERNLESFLTTERSGHCEFFATASTLFWRSLGIPARVVVGYRGGEYNDLIQSLEVREKDAHAWTEIYLPELGWYPLDSGPIIPRYSTSLTKQFISSMRKYATAMSFFLRQYMVDYDHHKQIQFLDSLQSSQFSFKSMLNFSEAPTNRTFAKLKILIFIVFFAAIFTLWFLVKKSDRSYKILPKFYREFIIKVKKFGLVKKESETFLTFHLRCIEKGIDKNLIKKINDYLEQELYAEKRVDQTELQLITQRIKKINIEIR